VNGGTNSDLFSLEGAGSSFKLIAESGSTGSADIMAYRLGLRYGSNDNGFIDFYRGPDGATGYLAFGASGAEKMRLDRFGNVGIGTVSPLSKLHIEETTNDADALMIRQVAGGSGSVQGKVHIGMNHFNSTYPSVRITAEEYDVADYRGNLAFSTRAATSDAVPTEKMRITHDGKVGIGTQSPDSKLEVSGSGVTALKITGSYPILYFDDADTGAYIANNANGLFIGKTNSPSSSNDIVKFDLTNSRVGIGTSSPDAKLEVNGGTNSDLFSLEGAGSSFKLIGESGDATSINSMAYRLGLRYGSNDNGFIDFYRGPDGATGFLSFGSSGTERMRINSSGGIKVGPNGGDTTNVFEIDTSGSTQHGLMINADQARAAGRYALLIDDEDPNGRGTMVIANASGDGLKITTQGSYTGLELVANNDGSNPAKTCHIDMTSYEGRGNGIFHFDANYSGQEWFSGLRYAGNMTNWHVGYDASGGQAEYIANAKILVDQSGNFHADADVIAFSTTTGSDRRLKKNIKDLPYGLNDILKLRAVEFDWKEKRGGKHDIGVIAQEIQEVIPEVVNEVQTIGKSSEELESHLSVDYGKIVSVLIKAVQEQQEQINKLEEKLNG
jgi:hypothetical protein